MVDNRGVSLFLAQLIEELHDGVSRTEAITDCAGEHGRNLLRQGYTVAQVVYQYGDVCQAVSEFAMDRAVEIATEDLRTLNRCLDDAIAGALTEYARGLSVARCVASQVTLRVLLDTATIAFDAIQTRRVGTRGSTGALLARSLEAMRTEVGHPVRPVLAAPPAAA